MAGFSCFVVPQAIFDSVHQGVIFCNKCYYALGGKEKSKTKGEDKSNLKCPVCQELMVSIRNRLAEQERDLRMNTVPLTQCQSGTV